jgi:hypothetical protein
LHVSPFVLIRNLYAGVPGLQGTDSGPWAHLGRGSEPVVGPTSLFPRCFLELCILIFEAGVWFYLWTRGDPGLARDAAAHEAPVDFPHAPQILVSGCCAVEVMGVEAIMTSFPEPPQRCVLLYGVEPFHTIPPGLHLPGSCWLTSGAWALLSASG